MDEILAGSSDSPPKVDVSICDDTVIEATGGVVETNAGSGNYSGPLPFSISCCGRGCVIDMKGMEESDNDYFDYTFLITNSGGIMIPTDLTLKRLTLKNLSRDGCFIIALSEGEPNYINVQDVEIVAFGDMRHFICFAD